jgi:hypothetical protein
MISWSGDLLIHTPVCDYIERLMVIASIVLLTFCLFSISVHIAAWETSAKQIIKQCGYALNGLTTRVYT